MSIQIQKTLAASAMRRTMINITPPTTKTPLPGPEAWARRKTVDILASPSLGQTAGLQSASDVPSGAGFSTRASTESTKTLYDLPYAVKGRGSCGAWGDRDRSCAIHHQSRGSVADLKRI